MYFGFVQDEIVLAPDDRSPKVAHITVRRQITLRRRPESLLESLSRETAKDE
jgi:hypothetical protein